MNTTSARVCECELDIAHARMHLSVTPCENVRTREWKVEVKTSLTYREDCRFSKVERKTCISYGALYMKRLSPGVIIDEMFGQV